MSLVKSLPNEWHVIVPLLALSYNQQPLKFASKEVIDSLCGRNAVCFILTLPFSLIYVVQRELKPNEPFLRSKSEQPKQNLATGQFVPLLGDTYAIMLVMKLPYAVSQEIETALRRLICIQNLTTRKNENCQIHQFAHVPKQCTLLLYSTEGRANCSNPRNYIVTPGSLGPHCHIHRSHVMNFTITWT